VSLFDRLKKGLARTHEGLVGRITGILSGRPLLSPELVDDFLDPLVACDMGVETAELVVEAVKRRVRRGEVTDTEALPAAVKEAIVELLLPAEGRLLPPVERPGVVFFVGVNGSGKTTTTAKIGHRWVGRGLKVSFAAADTFRAGAVEQLRIWSERVGAGFYTGSANADPSSVVYDALSAAKARGDDIVLVDTAGRLHTSANLMEELKKVQRTSAKVLPGSPHEVILVLDATTGQNALRQAALFHEALGLTGIALTKLDGTAKGGVIVALARSLPVPVKLIGVGEAEEDLQDFHAREFVEALFAD
jgi:fused signal recognition particle receptor